MSVWWNRSQVLPIPGLAERESGCVTCWHSRRGQRPQRGGHWPFRGGLKWKCSCNSICFFWRHDSRFRLLAWSVNCGISVHSVHFCCILSHCLVGGGLRLSSLYCCQICSRTTLDAELRKWMVLFWVLHCGHYWVLPANVMQNMQAVIFFK